MDESERLVTIAALASPERAIEAWNTWRATTEIADATGLLTWAGGYIHRNLLAAGVDDPYLGGIYRYNFIANNRRLAAALGTISELARRWVVSPIKSFGMTGSSYSRGLRPLADFDFYVSGDDVIDVKSYLEEQGFAANIGLSMREFTTRVLPQRGSWNFINAQRIDLDLHWRIFDHLDMDDNERLVAEHSRPARSEFGSIRQLNDELMLLILTAHSQLESNNRTRSLFDIYSLLKIIDVSQVTELAGKIRMEREVLAVADALRGLLGEDADPKLAELEESIRPGALARPFPSDVCDVPSQGESLTSRYVETGLMRDPEAYRTWFEGGRPSGYERPVSRITREVWKSSDPSDREPAAAGAPGIGWHYLYPGHTYRWANIPDARVVFRRVRRGVTGVRVELDDESWRTAPVAEVDVYCNGEWVGRCDNSESVFEFRIRRRRTVEISLRPATQSRFVDPGIHVNWHRMLAPVRVIRLV